MKLVIEHTSRDYPAGAVVIISENVKEAFKLGQDMAEIVKGGHEVVEGSTPQDMPWIRMPLVRRPTHEEVGAALDNQPEPPEVDGNPPAWIEFALVLTRRDLLVTDRNKDFYLIALRHFSTDARAKARQAPHVIFSDYDNKARTLRDCFAFKCPIAPHKAAARKKATRSFPEINEEGLLILGRHHLWLRHKERHFDSCSLEHFNVPQRLIEQASCIRFHINPTEYKTLKQR